jgi:hypothetical protein
MSLDEQIRRGHEAERLMNEPLLKEAFERVEAGVVDAMKRCKLGDHNTQHELVLMLQLTNKVKSIVQEHIQTGKLAKLEKETLAQKVKNRLRRVR